MGYGMLYGVNCMGHEVNLKNINGNEGISIGYSKKEKDILRELGEQIAEIAAMPINEQRAESQRKINNLEKAKPTIHIYDIPWHEMDVNDELKLRTKNPFCQDIERDLRRTLYLWRHMQGDMVVNPVIVQPLCIHDTGFGIKVKEDIVRTDDNNPVVSHHYHVQIKDEEDIEKIKMPEVTLDAQRTEEEYRMQCDVFDGILPVEKCGVGRFGFSPWDTIVQFTGVKEILIDMFRRPDYVHSIVDRLVTAELHRLDQYERLGLLQAPPIKLWGGAAAQIFAAVSPAMHEGFALKPESRLYERLGYIYYGCCEPLHNKVDILKKNIPRLRKISMSPWIDFDKAVENVRDEFVFAWKPNPAVLAAPVWDPEAVRKDMEEKLEKAKNCIVEIHMKDISTVRYQPQRLWEWAQIATKVTEKYAEV